jgi:hypothetical protein
MRKLGSLPASEAPHSARIGAQVTITLIEGDDSGQVLSGVVTDQPTTHKMGILLDGCGYIGSVRLYSQRFYRLLIQNRILIKSVDEVCLIAIRK